MTTGLFRLAFSVMFERTLTQFMKTTEGTELYRHTIFDYLLKSLVLIAVFESFYNPDISGILLILTGLLHFVRWILWKPQIGFRKFGNAIMYIGYLGLILNLVFEGFNRLGHTVGMPAMALHVFSFLTMGTVISGMFIRICQGHTGRKLLFTVTDKIAISSLIAGAFFRLVAPLIKMDLYSLWISLSAGLWAFCFLLLAIRLIPFLFLSRIDGREH